MLLRFHPADPGIFFRPRFLSIRIDIKLEIINEFEGSFLCIKSKELLDKIDHITILTTTKTVITPINLHAWSLIIVKRTAAHSVTSDL